MPLCGLPLIAFQFTVAREIRRATMRPFEIRARQRQAAALGGFKYLRPMAARNAAADLHHAGMVAAALKPEVIAESLR